MSFSYNWNKVFLKHYSCSHNIKFKRKFCFRVENCKTILCLIQFWIISSVNFEEISPLNFVPLSHISKHHSIFILVSDLTIGADRTNNFLENGLVLWMCGWSIKTELSCVDIQENIRFMIANFLIYTFRKWLTKCIWSRICFITLVFLSMTCWKVSINVNIWIWKYLLWKFVLIQYSPSKTLSLISFAK